MTLPDLLVAIIETEGPQPAGILATTVRKRKADVLTALHSDPRFVHRGKRRASRWDIAQAGSFTPADAAEQWGRWDCRPEDPPCSLELAEKFLVGFEERGLVERVNGNGRYQPTELGLELAAVLNGAA